MSFNGAVTLSLQKWSIPPPVKASRYCFNGAVTLSLQKYNFVRRPSKLSSSFNGAVTLSLQKWVWNSNIRCNIYSFNGAVTLSLQKLGIIAATNGSLAKSFNGAVTLSLQKSYVALVFFIMPLMLQWSCNFIVTEIT